MTASASARGEQATNSGTQSVPAGSRPELCGYVVDSVVGPVTEPVADRWARSSGRVRFRTEWEKASDRAATLRSELSLHAVLANLFCCRSVDSAAAVRDFLSPNLRTQLPDPFTVKNIEYAATLLCEAVKRGDAITIFTDFDVDGLTAGAQLYLYLRALGADVRTYTPNRFTEGYGLTMASAEAVCDGNTKLLLTVDCGISSVSEIAYVKSKGLRTIVLDHHQPGPVLPDADVIVNPAQGGCPFQELKLAAAGLAWLMLIVLRKTITLHLPTAVPPDPKDYLDLAGLGTICDMVPLVKLNRVLAFRGVEALGRSQRPGIAALRDVSGLGSRKEITSGQVGYVLGPRINAAGRLADAREVFTLLTTADSKKAKSLAQLLERINADRREVEEQVKGHCIARVRADVALLQQPALTLYFPEYHIGVLGIVAQRLVEEFHRPVAVMGIGEQTLRGKRVSVVKGSVRSISGFDVAKALHSLGDVLLSGGGHAAAGGFSLLKEKLPEFEKRFVDCAAACLSKDDLQRTWTIDLPLPLGEIDFQLAKDLQKLSPFGVGNPSPLFLTQGVRVEAATTVGAHHVKLRLSDGPFHVQAVAWQLNGHPLLRKGQKVTIAHHVELNTYQGVSSVQLNVQGLWPA